MQGIGAYYDGIIRNTPQGVSLKQVLSLRLEEDRIPELQALCDRLVSEGHFKNRNQVLENLLVAFIEGRVSITPNCFPGNSFPQMEGETLYWAPSITRI